METVMDKYLNNTLKEGFYYVLLEDDSTKIMEYPFKEPIKIVLLNVPSYEEFINHLDGMIEITNELEILKKTISNVLHHCLDLSTVLDKENIDSDYVKQIVYSTLDSTNQILNRKEQ